MRKIKIKKKSSLKKIPIKPKLLKIKKIGGRWCEYYSGRLPYPIECSYNKKTPVSYTYQGKEKTLLKDTSNCPNCKRSVKWQDWKSGKWDKVIKEIEKGHDLRNQPSPVIEE